MRSFTRTTIASTILVINILLYLDKICPETNNQTENSIEIFFMDLSDSQICSKLEGIYCLDLNMKKKKRDSLYLQIQFF